MKILLVRKKFFGHAHYSGYDRAFDFLEKILNESTLSIFDTYKTPFWLPASLFGKLKRRYALGTSFYRTSASLLTELKTFWIAYRAQPDLIHFGYLEDHYGVFRSPRLQKKLAGTKVMATVHCPTSWWKLYGAQHMFSNLDGLIVLSNSEIAYFQKFLPGKVHCVPHGIDTDFYRPDPERKDGKTFRCIFVGQWLRDPETLVYVVEKLLAQGCDIIFDIFYPRWKMHEKDYLYRIVNSPNVTFHNHVTDNVLLEHYQKADILLLPLFDCTANNAVLEGMACGLPVVSNDVPGIHTYVDNSFSCLSPVGDVEGMVRSVVNYYENRALVHAHSLNARAHVLKHFTWGRVAEKIAEVYQQILEEGK